jgi:hypothetical protein
MPSVALIADEVHGPSPRFRLLVFIQPWFLEPSDSSWVNGFINKGNEADRWCLVFLGKHSPLSICVSPVVKVGTVCTR